MVSEAIAGIDWLAGNHQSPAVANMSVGLNGVSDAGDQAIRGTIASGVVFVAPAGNSGGDPSTLSPCRVQEAITVGGTDSSDNRWLSSNYGPLVDLFAPAQDIAVAEIIDANGIPSDSATKTNSGTSLSAAYASGVAAIYLQGNPTASPAAVQQSMIDNSTVDKIINPGSRSPNRLLFKDLNIH